ncbi:L-ribulose-5-phosphate 3-epimerase [Thorsellia anophelis]|uniref:L-ribulose-5-phosphate 3-epimerase n=1 Tax=Thorsellia anophelis DSM 18579 TaxID=1123402 RepID=A0A1I0B7Y0_9GAMM|nr:L-ribulose-5-phosphate 3-epimerase [Thorsellia anophelis]SET02876.1 hexulose-6-phosphate isomerase [Thorsellia anophelis DSM 18579]
MEQIKNKLGIYEKAMPATLTWRERFATAKSLGFDFFEISIDETDERRARLDWSHAEIKEIIDLIHEFEMPIQSMCLSAHRKFPYGSSDPSVRLEADNIMQKALKLAHVLGIRVIQLAGYDVYYEPQTAESHTRFIEGMYLASKQAEQFGIMLGVEIMDTAYLNSLSKFEILKQNIPSPFFMAYPDVGNISGWNYDIATELKLSKHHIVQVHLKDTLFVKPGFKGQFRDLVIGEGQVDFPVVFQALKECNYAAPLVIEMWASDENWEKNIVTAKNRLREIASDNGFYF